MASTPLSPEKQAEIEDLARAIHEAVDGEIHELAANLFAAFDADPGFGHGLDPLQRDLDAASLARSGSHRHRWAPFVGEAPSALMIRLRPTVRDTSFRRAASLRGERLSKSFFPRRYRQIPLISP